MDVTQRGQPCPVCTSQEFGPLYIATISDQPSPYAGVPDDAVGVCLACGLVTGDADLLDPPKVVRAREAALHQLNGQPCHNCGTAERACLDEINRSGRWCCHLCGITPAHELPRRLN